jgi:hypothetical protein
MDVLAMGPFLAKKSAVNTSFEASQAVVGANAG